MGSHGHDVAGDSFTQFFGSTATSGVRIMDLKVQQAYWDHLQVTKRNWWNAQHRTRLEATFGEMKRLLKRADGKSVLDIGFGDGYLLKRLSGFGLRCFGMDISEENVRLTKAEFVRDGINASFATATCLSLPFSEGSFDVIVACEVLEHLTDAESKLLLEEARRCLKVHGYIIITTPYNENLEISNIVCPKCLSAINISGHMQSFCEDKISALLSNSGFQVLESKHFSIPPEPFKFKIAPLLSGFVNWVVNSLYR